VKNRNHRVRKKKKIRAKKETNKTWNEIKDQRMIYQAVIRFHTGVLRL